MDSPLIHATGQPWPAHGPDGAAAPLHVVWAGDPAYPDCPHAHWTDCGHHGILHRTCDRCSLTLCSLPAVDACLYQAPYTAALGLPRLLEVLYRPPSCDRFTTGRCPVCAMPTCADHRAAHAAHDCTPPRKEDYAP